MPANKMSKPSIITTVGLTLLSARGNLAAELDYNQAPPNLTELTGTELYHTWRPKAHVAPLFGRIQDPCAHYTDSETGSFHVGFLLNTSTGPMTSSGGMSACKTDDLVTYEDVNPLGGKFITEGGKNDPLGVFDGSVVSNGIDGYPTLMYSGVKFLPITWSMSYYPQSETQSIAVSRDGGKNFEKLDRPPVIVQPEGIEPTAFRDPYMFHSYQLDSLLGGENGTLYATVSGGVKGSNPEAPGWEADAGPGQFLYRQQAPDNFLDWEYLGMWWREAANSTTSNNSWAVTWGFNMETANLANLDEQGINNVDGELFHLIGAEYSTIWDGVVRNYSSWEGQFKRHGNWATGNVSLRPGTKEPVFTPTVVSRLDWGLTSYAAAAQILTADSEASTKSGVTVDRWITYIWLSGDEFGTLEFYPPAAQNWTGALCLPRELSVGYIDNIVLDDLSTETPAAWVIESRDDKTNTARLKTLKQVVARETLAALQDPATTTAITEPGTTISQPGEVPFAKSPSSRFFTLSANLTFPASARESGLRAGFQILASENERTNIWYQLSSDTFSIDRSQSSAAALSTEKFDLREEKGLFRLFDIERSGNVEVLRLTMVVDNSVVEIFANERFGLASQIK